MFTKCLVRFEIFLFFLFFTSYRVREKKREKGREIKGGIKRQREREKERKDYNIKGERPRRILETNGSIEKPSKFWTFRTLL